SLRCFDSEEAKVFCSDTEENTETRDSSSKLETKSSNHQTKESNDSPKELPLNNPAVPEEFKGASKQRLAKLFDFLRNNKKSQLVSEGFLNRCQQALTSDSAESSDNQDSAAS